MNKQEAKVAVVDEETLRGLLPELRSIFPEHIAQQYLDLICVAMTDTNEKCDWWNAKITLVDGAKTFSIISGNGNHTWVLYTEDGKVDIVKSVRKEYLDESITADVINKRVLGKAIIKYVGHEGVEGDVRQQGLRKLLQATIDYIQTHAVSGVWENATITIYDSEDNKFQLQSGNGKNRFIVNETKGKPTIRYTVNNKVKELKNTSVQT